MTCGECVEKNCGRDGECKWIGFFLAITVIIFICNFSIRPWTILELEIFVFAQVLLLTLIVATKMLEMCCCSFELGDSPRYLNNFYFMTSILWTLSTIDGFCHPDINFDTVIVE